MENNLDNQDAQVYNPDFADLDVIKTIFMKAFLFVFFACLSLAGFGQVLTKNPATPPSTGYYTLGFNPATANSLFMRPRFGPDLPAIVDATANGFIKSNIKYFGAKGNGVADDRGALLSAMTSNRTLQFEPGSAYYKVTGYTAVTNQSNLIIDLNGAQILFSDTTQQGLYFLNCHKLTLKNGTIGYAYPVHQNGNGQQHIVMFQNCTKVVLDNVQLTNSPEMGVALVNCQNVAVTNSFIGPTMRDGIYARYCNDVLYENSTFVNCKDDAMSFHDKDNLNPSVDPDKLLMIKRGFQQASGVTVRNCRAYNCYQGFSSIGASNVVVDGLITRHTVNASVSIFHIPNSSADSTRVNNVKIMNCTLDSAGRDAYFAGTLYPNFGRTTTGRASIFIGSLGNDGAGHLVVNAGETKRLSNITLQNNTVQRTGSNGLWISLADNVTLNNNTFIDAANVNLPTGVAAIAVELASITNLRGRDNSVSDTRPSGALQYGVKFDGVQLNGRAIELFSVSNYATSAYGIVSLNQWSNGN